MEIFGIFERNLSLHSRITNHSLKLDLRLCFICCWTMFRSSFECHLPNAFNGDLEYLKIAPWNAQCTMKMLIAFRVFCILHSATSTIFHLKSLLLLFGPRSELGKTVMRNNVGERCNRIWKWMGKRYSINSTTKLFD